MRNLSLIAAVMLMLFMGTAFSQSPPLVGAAGGKLENLAGTNTLVTVVINDSGAQDKNLRVLEVGPDYVCTLSDRGDRFTYLFRSIKEIRVQEGQEAVRMWAPAQAMGLLPAQQQVVARAIERAGELFEASDDNQTVKMEAALLLALAGDSEQQERSVKYLQDIHASNDLGSSMLAGYRLYLLGKDDGIDTLRLEEALVSGNRMVSLYALKLAGLIRYKPAEPTLLKMMRDRRPDVSSYAVYALARLGNREIIPTLIAMLPERNEEKGEAAVFALSRLGDEQTAEELKTMLKSSEGMTRYRLARVLHGIGDPESKAVLRDEIMEIPTLQVYAALILVKEGDVKAMRILRERLLRRYDEVESTLLLRAQMAAALIQGNDRTVVPILQELLRNDITTVQQAVCRLVTILGIRSLSTIVQPTLESGDPEVAIAASKAAISTVYPEFRKRQVEMWD